MMGSEFALEASRSVGMFNIKPEISEFLGEHSANLASIMGNYRFLEAMPFLVSQLSVFCELP
jgi:hypothetical protein